MTEIKKAHAAHPDFLTLVKGLDQELAVHDGDMHEFFQQFSKSSTLNEVLIAYVDGVPAACGALRKYTDDTVEVKRMYVDPQFRGLKLSRAILQALETLAKTQGFKYGLLETIKGETPAVKLYLSHGYEVIPNYGQYAGIENSLCMRKALDHQ